MILWPSMKKRTTKSGMTTTKKTKRDWDDEEDWDEDEEDLEDDDEEDLEDDDDERTSKRKTN